METIKIRIQRLRQRMSEENIDAYLVLSEDFHGSEYVGDYFKCREYITGFTGSAGNAVFLQDEAGLWTDGRYFLQAEEQLKGSGVTLFRMGEEGVPKLEDWLAEKLQPGQRLAVDGRTLSVERYRKLKEKLDEKQAQIRVDCDLIGEIWEGRPAMSKEAAWELESCYAGKSREEKVAAIRRKLTEKKADLTALTALEDIAWTLNVRGGDIACTPVVLSYLLVSQARVVWFVQREAVSASLTQALRQSGVEIMDYDAAYDVIGKEAEQKTVYLDPDKMNIALCLLIKKAAGRVIEGRNLTQLPKAIKNETEVEHMRQAHRKDGVACTRFLYWLKSRIGQERITELSAAEKLEAFRREQAHYLGPSFDTIAGYNAHGAIVHYSATPETDSELAPLGLLLVDSGGHYLEGTTDITRTIALGALSYEQKHHYTLVLRGNIRLAAAKFLYGCAGISLDNLARGPLWEEGLDYNHGTGHGVGYLLGVHEPPNSFRFRTTDSRDECVKLEEGMITSDEPGLYLAGRYGIRLENLLVCKKLEKNEYGQFMGFDTLTLVPFEREAILADEMEKWELAWLNAYHAHVAEALADELPDAEREWLLRETKSLGDFS